MPIAIKAKGQNLSMFAVVVSTIPKDVVILS
jgi:hypothetical protein